MKSPMAWAAVAAVALGAGGLLWWSGRPEPQVAPPTISGAAVFAATFHDLQGKPQSLGQFQGRPVLVNFWATWCGPCREEMPLLDRAAREWNGRVAFVGVSDEAPEIIARFQEGAHVGYPLWTGGEANGDLSKRLGNRMAVLPFTALLDGAGNVKAAKVGAYSAQELDQALRAISAK